MSSDFRNNEPALAAIPTARKVTTLFFNPEQ
jgi:hypothetical protein